MKVEHAPDVYSQIIKITKILKMKHIDCARIKCFRSFDAKSNAIARIWSLPKIWQRALGIKPHYVIEVLSENYDKLNEEEKIKTLIHELLHIPKNFSGAVLSHNRKIFDGRGGHKRHRIDKEQVERLFKIFQKSR